jgi:hypothetical protein
MGYDLDSSGTEFEGQKSLELGYVDGVGEVD